ncbi:MAG: hypothetical protein HZT41_12140 [Dechloromonas sp.]|nr:MAG: hypothetical protein HZT41_12140 [Dechloromonas sp.]
MALPADIDGQQATRMELAAGRRMGWRFGLSPAPLIVVAWQLNARPRKTLNWLYPATVFMPESSDFKQHFHQLVALRT